MKSQNVKSLLVTLSLVSFRDAGAFCPMRPLSAPRAMTGIGSFFAVPDTVVDVSSVAMEDDDNLQQTAVGAVSEEAMRLKGELYVLAGRTDRGFQANNEDRKRAREIITDLAKSNPTAEPARAYYKDNTMSNDEVVDDSNKYPSISGKWTLVYTDAPDITSLAQNPLAQLGRIGQECDPPFIKNVIEWKRPSWASGLPLSGGDDTRILQKVVTEASATPDRPTMVDLQVAGLQVEAGQQDGEDQGGRSSIERNGLVAGLLQNQPVNLQGQLRTPFGRFEVLYMDEEIRIIKTNQGYISVNRRSSGESWF